jgi:hypothetical protein
MPIKSAILKSFDRMVLKLSQPVMERCDGSHVAIGVGGSMNTIDSRLGWIVKFVRHHFLSPVAILPYYWSDHNRRLAVCGQILSDGFGFEARFEGADEMRAQKTVKRRVQG